MLRTPNIKQGRPILRCLGMCHLHDTSRRRAAFGRTAPRSPRPSLGQTGRPQRCRSPGARSFAGGTARILQGRLYRSRRREAPHLRPIDRRLRLSPEVHRRGRPADHFDPYPGRILRPAELPAPRRRPQCPGARSVRSGAYRDQCAARSGRRAPGNRPRRCGWRRWSTPRSFASGWSMSAVATHGCGSRICCASLRSGSTRRASAPKASIAFR